LHHDVSNIILQDAQVVFALKEASGQNITTEQIFQTELQLLELMPWQNHSNCPKHPVLTS
jgi:hypothetical protein